MRPYLEEEFANPAGVHRRAHRVRQALGGAREQCAALLGARKAEEIVFTSSGSEAANLAIKGVAEFADQPGRIVVSSIEHPAVRDSAKYLASHGWEISEVLPDSVGGISPEALQHALADGAQLVAIHLANHDIGTIEPIRELAEMAHAAGAIFFCDAVAAGGWLPIDVNELGVDLLSISPQRFGGPKGIGILWKESSVRLAPQIHGGVQEDGLRGGTENIPGIIGAGAAAQDVLPTIASRAEQASKQQQRLLNGLRQKIEELHLNGPEPGTERLPNQLNISIEGLEGEALALALDVQGVAVAAGASCVSRELKTPPVLAAIGVPPKLAQASVTLSIGSDTSDDEIEAVLDIFPRVVARLRSMSPSWKKSSSTRTQAPARFAE